MTNAWGCVAPAVTVGDGFAVIAVWTMGVTITTGAAVALVFCHCAAFFRFSTASAVTDMEGTRIALSDVLKLALTSYSSKFRKIGVMICAKRGVLESKKSAKN